MTEGRNGLIVALDVNERGRAIELVDALKGQAGMFKVGMELFYSTGGGIVRDIKEKGCRVFLDLKLHDIPNTVARSCRVLTALGPDIVNVHASGGPDMMREAAAAVRDEAAKLGVPAPMVIAVTILTSIDREMLNGRLGIPGEVRDCVVRWSSLALDCGLDGVVSSPLEVAAIREACGPGFKIITPGVRPAGAETGDQRRVTTPSGAIKAGADYIVVGRPITASADPRESAKKIVEEIKGCAV
ncbi:MAG: orotidine-5'-phosphate decarboxylase [Bacillota bacterium]